MFKRERKMIQHSRREVDHDVLVRTEEIKLFRVGEKALGSLLAFILISSFGWMWTMNATQAEHEVRIQETEKTDLELEQNDSHVVRELKEMRKEQTTAQKNIIEIQTNQKHFEQQFLRLLRQQEKMLDKLDAL